MDILKRHQEFVNHLVQFVEYCCLKESLEVVDLEPLRWHTTLQGIVKSVDKDILTKSTLDGLKALKLVNCVMEDSPDLTKVANLLHCFSYSSSPHVEEFCSLCKEAKIQAVVRCAEDSGVEAAFELIQEYFASEKVLMKTLQEVVGALKGGKGNAFPPPVQHFLHSHTFEAFHASLKNFCKGLIYEAPEPCLLEYFREHFSRADTAQCSSVSVVNPYLSSLNMTQEVVVDSQSAGQERCSFPPAVHVLQDEQSQDEMENTCDWHLHVSSPLLQKQLHKPADSVMEDVDQLDGQENDPQVENPEAERDLQIVTEMDQQVVTELDQQVGVKRDQQVEPELDEQVEPELDQQVEPELDEQVEPELDEQVEPELDEQVEPELDQQVEPGVDEQVEPELDQPVEAGVCSYTGGKDELIVRGEQLNERLHHQAGAVEGQDRDVQAEGEPVIKANKLITASRSGISGIGRKLDFSDGSDDGDGDGDDDDEYVPGDTPVEEAASFDPFEYSSEKDGPATCRKMTLRNHHPEHSKSKQMCTVNEDVDVQNDSGDDHRMVVSSTQSSAQPTAKPSPRPSRLRQVVNKTTTAGETVDWSSDESPSVTTPPSRLPKALEITRRSPASFNPPTRSRANKQNPTKKRIPWSKKDEHTLREGVRRHGIGCWRKILSSCKFEVERSNVDIKDKWRNMSKEGL